MNFWRSQDIYSDHMVCYYERNGVPRERIDNTGFMVGTTGTCYKRGTAAWKGMLLLEHARGGWMNVYHGNLELIDRSKAEWFAKVQSLYLKLQALGCTRSFGGLPGREEPYGFCSANNQGSLYAVVNPAQAIRAVPLPQILRFQSPNRKGRVLFRDAGFIPRLANDVVTLGPEQLALVGFGEYAKPGYDLGIEPDIVIPVAIEKLEAAFTLQGYNLIAAAVSPPATGSLRVIMRQSYRGHPWRTSRGAPPNGTPLGQVLVITASQENRILPVQINYNKAIWSGLSWAVGEIAGADCLSVKPVQIRCRSMENEPMELKAEVFLVRYSQPPP